MSRLDDIEAILVALGAGATLDEVEYALRDYPDREVRAVLAERSAAGGGGAAFPDEWTIGASGAGSLEIALADTDDTALSLNGGLEIDGTSRPMAVEVDNTEVLLVDTDGKLRVTPSTNTSNGAQPAFVVDAPATITNLLRLKSGANSIWTVDKDGGCSFALGSVPWLSVNATGILMVAPAGSDIELCDADYNLIVQATDDNRLGFYGQSAVAQQTGVAVNLAAIHAALVNLGLITA